MYKINVKSWKAISNFLCCVMTDPFKLLWAHDFSMLCTYRLYCPVSMTQLQCANCRHSMRRWGIKYNQKLECDRRTQGQIFQTNYQGVVSGILILITTPYLFCTHYLFNKVNCKHKTNEFSRAPSALKISVTPSQCPKGMLFRLVHGTDGPGLLALCLSDQACDWRLRLNCHCISKVEDKCKMMPDLSWICNLPS